MITKDTVPNREINDGLQKAISDATGLACPPEEDQTRQEFKQETDVNYIVSRFMPEEISRMMRPVRFGEVINFDDDLMTSLGKIDNAAEAHRNLPEDLRKDYPTWTDLAKAINDGTFQEKVNTRKAKAEQPPPA